MCNPPQSPDLETDMNEIEMRGITKTFPGVIADDNVDFFVKSGEIHALMGENGAGKSILMSILAGLHQPDSGEIFVRGKKVDFKSPLNAIDAGIGMVFQEFQLFPSMSLLDNIIFRHEPTKKGFISHHEAYEKVKNITVKYGLEIDLCLKARDAQVGILQRVEIIKALYREAKILILDEPTAVLTPQETDRLFEVLRVLRQDGYTIILITHKLREVMEISDRVTVLRDGKVTARLNTDETTPEEISRHMTGRDIDLSMSKPQIPPGDPILKCEHISIAGSGNKKIVNDVSLTVCSGEIVGIAGVAGNGQTELAQAIAGLKQVSNGTIQINGTDITFAGVNARRQAGLSFVPEDRQGVGAAPKGTAVDNLCMGHHRNQPIKRNHLLDRKEMVRYAKKLIANYSIRIANENIKVGTLSGGNLQKILVARELDYKAPLLIAEQPTRGVDIGAIQFVHQQLVDYRDKGGGILLISAELSEILSLSSRVLVMYEGKIMADIPIEEATEEKLGLLMAGSTKGQQ